MLFIVGSWFEHNDFTGIEIQPNARLMWTSNTENSIWMAVSRAENDAIINITPQLQSSIGSPLLPFPITALLNGSSGFNSEKLIAYELG